MKVSEIFLSIDGEGKRTGQPTWFIRKFGCNCRCSYCFGDRGGKFRTPELRLGYKNNVGIGSHRISIKNVRVGQNVMTLDENMNLVETTIVDVMSRDVNEWYEVKINGRTYCITGNHPLFTTRGIIEVKDLNVDDYILDVCSNEYLSYMSRVENNQSKPEFKQKQVQNTDWKAQGESVRRSVQKRKEEGTYVSTWNMLSEDKKDELRRKISAKNSGANNGMYREDSIHCPNYTRMKKQIKSGEITRSELSGKTPEEDNAKTLYVHHIDNDRNNDDPDNLIVVTSREHNRIHARGYNFWVNQESRSDGKKALIDVNKHNGKRVESIKYVDITKNSNFGRPYGPKPLKVYNFTCYPYNTYLIDDMWVHNCDSKYTFEGDDYTDMAVDEIIDKLQERSCMSVTYTGGEPLWASTSAEEEEIHELLQKLCSLGYDVNVETNGSVDLVPFAKYKQQGLWFTMDVKSISSGMARTTDLSNILLLDDKDVIKFVVGNKDDLDQMRSVIDTYSPIQAQIYVSPIFGMIEPKDIVDYVLQNRLYNVKTQVQLHKIIWDPTLRGV